jgi:hypothetical protein
MAFLDIIAAKNDPISMQRNHQWWLVQILE